MTYVYLTLDDILAIHEDLIIECGGLHGIRDINLVESAANRPLCGYYQDLFGCAAALMESLANNHGFIDGDKRVAFWSTDVFLRLNGYYINIDPVSGNNFIQGALEHGNFNFNNILNWLRINTIRLEE